ncbi:MULTISPECIES: hypothetical protein [Streptomyces]|uniref:hypothetical protein n=1 Tax=Streptomyces TaxID=1883 RepID=UPI002248855A|nr:hypothetical protein [Streptomyces sp. JHD 1]MCX2968185.1 hypothetical protein [Streptomyces sp. JHD 1]
MKKFATLAVSGLLILAAPATAIAEDGGQVPPQSQATEGLARGDAAYGADTDGVGTLAYPKGCGIQVNFPHASNSYEHEIHTRIVSACDVLPLASNTVSGKTYRSRWYGWQQVATLPAKTKTAGNVQEYRRTVVANCSEGNWYRYRTEGFGTISTGVQSYSAAAYEQNDDEIVCR